MKNFLSILFKKFQQSIKSHKTSVSQDAIDFFVQQKLNSNEKCNNLANQYDKSLKWDRESVSIHSPYSVSDNEILARNIFSPIHFNEETGILDPLAFEDILNKGLSLIRKDYCGCNGVIEYGKKKLNEDRLKGHGNRQYIGFFTIKTEYLRSYVDSDIKKQIIAVYNTAEKDFKEHADACAIIKLNRPQKTRLRMYLREKFSEIVFCESV